MEAEGLGVLVLGNLWLQGVRDSRDLALEGRGVRAQDWGLSIWGPFSRGFAPFASLPPVPEGPKLHPYH